MTLQQIPCSNESKERKYVLHVYVYRAAEYQETTRAMFRDTCTREPKTFTLVLRRYYSILPLELHGGSSWRLNRGAMKLDVAFNTSRET